MLAFCLLLSLPSHPSLPLRLLSDPYGSSSCTTLHPSRLAITRCPLSIPDINRFVVLLHARTWMYTPPPPHFRLARTAHADHSLLHLLLAAAANSDLDCTSSPQPVFEADIKQLSRSCQLPANVPLLRPRRLRLLLLRRTPSRLAMTKCFEILGDSKESCFAIPRPPANNIAFWPNSTCTLFIDEDCTQNAFTPALGAITNVKQNSWSCVANAA
ncbi:hypothetical protein EXIGLDRAFT_707349 [Exidia glandulosa HHB12029]|uniref:Uncharacterized protein n=1 Tax=Exidia glandulosa HHB12029 TaxID=1314781 RepID=A0A166NKA6_EXIGL|nr:hypothetical protein EXIGLDRAFT_707349 [Exidia glandulosa HHB12029]